MKKFLAIMMAGAVVLSMAGMTGCSCNTASGSETAGSSDNSQSVSDSADNADSSAADDSAASATADSSAAEQPGEADSAALPVAMKPDLLSAAIQDKLGLDEQTAAKAAEDMLPLLMYTQGDPVRVAKVIRKLQAGEEVTIAYLGGSITQGTGADNENCYAALTTKWIESQYPDAKVNYVNAGIGATGSYIGVHRCDAQVLSHDPDLVFIDFSVNDESQNNAINKLTYEGLIRKIWKHSSNPGIICIAMTQDNGTSVQDCHGEVTEKYSVPFVSYHDAMLNFLNTNDVQWSDISGDNIHPNMSGHAILSAMLTTYLQYVTDNLDSIGDTDPELAPAGDEGAKYENAVLLTTDEAQPVTTGAFEMKQMEFGGFKNPWIAKLPADAEITDDDAFVIEVEAQNIGLLYAKLTSNAGMADVYVDDELVATINADFTGGWGNYVNFTQVKSFMSSGKHTLKIVPKPGAEGKPFAFYISGITIS